MHRNGTKPYEGARWVKIKSVREGVVTEESEHRWAFLHDIARQRFMCLKLCVLTLYLSPATLMSLALIGVCVDRKEF
ncbi:hypothetical protein Ccrd_020221 [Cynara cardunculus var. scolymus]|uniref:Uncharacterized protein n=1 Tax=Cynara cardunculus var. scolymus TaxID=59895 RepID=A0A103Y2V6_CYNCS|nr:hypothetical protein Ccrd_020221 [Cynara cardunculus var. scolymus]